MGVGEGVNSGCGCGLSTPKLGLSKRLSKSLESLRPKRRNNSTSGFLEKHSIFGSMLDVARRSGRSPAGKDRRPGTFGFEDNTRGGRPQEAPFGRNVLQRSSGRGRKVAPHTPDEYE